MGSDGQGEPGAPMIDFRRRRIETDKASAHDAVQPEVRKRHPID